MEWNPKEVEVIPLSVPQPGDTRAIGTYSHFRVTYSRL